MAEKIIGNNLCSDEARKELLHILPQGTYHDQAEIRGSNVALRRFGEALIEASKKGQGQQVKISMMASDGEGYQVVIHPMSDQQIDAGPLPYAQLGQDWEFIRADSQSAHRLANLPALIEAAELALHALSAEAIGTHNPENQEWYESVCRAGDALRSALNKIQGGDNADQ